MNALGVKPLVLMIVISFALFFSGSIIFTEAQSLSLDFGGPILLNQPVCVSPPAALVNVGPPAGGQFMYLLGGSFSYDAGPPRNPGQQLLGKLGPAVVPCLIPCPLGVCPHPQGGGPPILFHGSSTI